LDSDGVFCSRVLSCVGCVISGVVRHPLRAIAARKIWLGRGVVWWESGRWRDGVACVSGC
jgi:hypothetical protein